MQITLNGQPKTIQNATHLDQLITQLGLANKPVAAEINRNLIPKKQHATTTINEGDQIELVTLGGGG
jgi:thiamine biosynthesis protein ThiS